MVMGSNQLQIRVLLLFFYKLFFSKNFLRVLHTDWMPVKWAVENTFTLIPPLPHYNAGTQVLHWPITQHCQERGGSRVPILWHFCFVLKIVEGVLNILTKTVAHSICANYNRKNVCISFNHETRKEANIKTVKVISNKDLIWCMRTEASNQCVFF